MTTEKTFYIPVGMKKYPLIIIDKGEVDTDDGAVVNVTCDIINLNQGYLKEDLPLLFMDIQEMIESELAQKSDAHLHIRLKTSEKQLIEKRAQKEGYRSISQFVKEKVLA